MGNGQRETDAGPSLCCSQGEPDEKEILKNGRGEILRGLEGFAEDFLSAVVP